MIKNATIYSYQGESLDFSKLPVFAPCEPSRREAIGFVPPRGHAHGLLTEPIGKSLILKVMHEARVLPSDAVNRATAQAAELISQQTGRRPGRKQLREIKEEVVLTLLPKALTRRSTATVWIDTAAKRIVIGASGKKLDTILTMLVWAVEGFTISPLVTESNPTTLMANYLLNGTYAHFSVGREVELKSCDESKAIVRYNRHTLDIPEVQNHLRQGKVPTKLALTWRDRVSFTLTDSLQLRKITLLDVTHQGSVAEDDQFDADAALFTGEVSHLIDDLIYELT